MFLHSFAYNMPPSSRSPICPFIHSLADSLTPCVLSHIYACTPPCRHPFHHACITHSIALSHMTLTHTFTRCCHVPADTSSTSMQSARTCSFPYSATCAASLSTLALVRTKCRSSMATFASLLKGRLDSALSFVLQVRLICSGTSTSSARFCRPPEKFCKQTKPLSAMCS